MGSKKFEVPEDRANFLASKTGTVTAPLFMWLSVQGNICLALRHPQNRGASRPWAEQFVKQLGKMLVAWGALTEEELKEAEKIEIEEGSTGIGGA